jgi:hypothetical protein
MDMWNRMGLWLRTLLARCFRWRSRPALPRELDDAQKLIRAVDMGGVPLNPARINQIAINLGLEVSRKAPQEQTIARIRAAVTRAESARFLR